jgi:hypothetical protein
MLPQELFSLLTVDNIEFNGDVELTDDGILWIFNIDKPEIGNEIIFEDELIEAFEEDVEYINSIFEEYEEYIIDIDVEEILIDNNIMYADLAIININIEE